MSECVYESISAGVSRAVRAGTGWFEQPSRRVGNSITLATMASRESHTVGNVGVPPAPATGPKNITFFLFSLSLECSNVLRSSLNPRSANSKPRGLVSFFAPAVLISAQTKRPNSQCQPCSPRSHPFCVPRSSVFLDPESGQSLPIEIEPTGHLVCITSARRKGQGRTLFLDGEG